MKAFKKFTALFLALLMIASTGAALTFNTAAADTFEKTGDAYYVNNANFNAFVTAVNADTTETPYFAGEKVYLTEDIDLSATTYTTRVFAQFSGELDGQGHSIIGFTINKTGPEASFIRKLVGGTIKNIAFVNASITITSNTTNNNADAAIIAQTTTDDCVFENVYVGGTITVPTKGKTAACARVAGFVANGNSGTAADVDEVKFENCVSEVVLATQGAQRVSGFIAQMGAYVNYTFDNCAFIGDISKAGNWSSNFCGLTTNNVEFNNCISLGKSPDVAASGIFTYVDNQNNASYAPSLKTISFNDCYAIEEAAVAGDKTTQNLIVGAEVSATRGTGVETTLTISYGGTQVYSDSFTATKSGSLYVSEDHIYLVKDNIEAKLVENGAYISRSAETAVVADSYNALLKTGDWTVTNDTVDTAVGAVPEIIPASVAKMLGKTALESPTGAKRLQVRDNGTSYDVRIVGTVYFTDAEAYEKVGFEYSVKRVSDGKVLLTDTYETDKVFTSIVADNETVSASDEDIAADGFNLIEFCGFADGDAYEITVLSYAKKGDAVTYNYAGAFTVTVQNGALAE